MSAQNKRAIILLSGGLDSATIVAIAQSQGYAILALTFNYCQRHHIEIQSARRIAVHHQVRKHLEITIDLSVFGQSALTAAIAVPKHRTLNAMKSGIPITYVPARNTIFLSYALAYAEVTQSAHIFLGVNAVDYSGYPDCRPEYINAYSVMANLATKAGVEGEQLTIHTPLIHMTKADIIKTGMELGVDYGLTHSCYDPTAGGMACGQCDSCILRLKGFADAGMVDPVPYMRVDDKP